MDMLHKLVSTNKITLGVLALFALFTFSVKAGIPEKYGEKFSSGGKVWYEVQFEGNWTSLPSGVQVRNISTITYNSDGSVQWDWETIYDYCIRVKGIRIDEAGSFKVKAGDEIGYDYWHGTGSNGYSYQINIYPMMQYDGLDILLTDCENIIFRVSPDNTIRMECDNANIPAQAEIGFGPIYTNYSEYDSTDYEDYYSNYYSKKYKYGPGWKMFLNFSMKPVNMGMDSIDGIIDDSMKIDAPVYDILGNMVDRNNLSPGIYIYRGKKILVK